MVHGGMNVDIIFRTSDTVNQPSGSGVAVAPFIGRSLDGSIGQVRLSSGMFDDILKTLLLLTIRNA